MTRGRKPVPRNVKARRGTLKPSRDPGPVVLTGRPVRLEPAGDLSPAARQVWDELAPVLVDVGAADHVDRFMLTELCAALGLARDARAVLDAEGLFVEGRKGGTVVHPAMRVHRDAVTLAHRLAVEYGLTPSARERLGLTAMRRRSMFEELRAAGHIPGAAA